MNAAERQELFRIIKERSFREGDFTLASGRKSRLYFNLKPTMMLARGAYLSARAFLDIIHAEKAEYIGGLEMGAVPLIGSIAALSEAEKKPVNTFFVRKQVKDHGTGLLLEGLMPGETLAGKRVLILDDVATTGGSIWKAVEAARASGAQVDASLVMIDREEGSAEYLAERGVRLLSVFKGKAFLA